jgi:hypothetical protein
MAAIWKSVQDVEGPLFGRFATTIIHKAQNPRPNTHSDRISLQLVSFS